MVDRQSLIKKLQQLSDDDLKKLLQFAGKDNMQILKLAEHEATRRNIDLDSIKVLKESSKNDNSTDLLGYLAAFFQGL